jgi:hypothetical protein
MHSHTIPIRYTKVNISVNFCVRDGEFLRVSLSIDISQHIDDIRIFGDPAMNNVIEMRIIIGWVVLLFGILVIYLFFWKGRRK